VSDSTYFAAEAGTEPEDERLRLLESVYDPGTIEMLRATGVQPGWRCLVPGAGHGSIARWLADLVGPDGLVVATDIDTRFLASCAGPNLEVRQHDLLADPLEANGFDLVHVRALLVHLPGRQQEAVDRLVAAVRPGGWLAVDESDVTTFGSADPAHPAHQTVNEIVASGLDVIKAHLDVLGGRHVAGMLSRHRDLCDVTTDITATMERGGSPRLRLTAQNFGVMLPALTQDGQVSAASAQVCIDALSSDPSFLFIPEMRYQILARKIPD
jgi:SAM-dependent methyltransferase